MYEPHLNLQRWQTERALEKERQNALAASGVSAGVAYERPGGALPAENMRSSNVLKPVPGIRALKRQRADDA